LLPLDAQKQPLLNQRKRIERDEVLYREACQ